MAASPPSQQLRLVANITDFWPCRKHAFSLTESTPASLGEKSLYKKCKLNTAQNALIRKAFYFLRHDSLLAFYDTEIAR